MLYTLKNGRHRKSAIIKQVGLVYFTMASPGAYLSTKINLCYKRYGMHIEESMMKYSNSITHVDRLRGFFKKGYYVFIIPLILNWQEWRCARARQYLLTHDERYRSIFIDSEVVRRREKLYREGVSPLDPRVPDIFSLEKELPPLKWPQKRFDF